MKMNIQRIKHNKRMFTLGIILFMLMSFILIQTRALFSIEDPCLDEETYTQIQDQLDFGISSTRIAAIKRIEESNCPAYYAFLDEIIANENDDGVIIQALKSISKLELNHLAPIISERFLTEDTDDDVLIEAMRCIGDMGFQDAYSAVYSFIEGSSDLRVQETALDTIGELSIQESATQLQELFNHPDLEEILKQRIIINLGKIGNPVSTEFLISTYNRVSVAEHTKMYCLTSLGDLGTREGLDILLEAVQSSNPLFKLRAIEALGRMPFTEALPAILEQLRNDNDGVRLEALKAIDNQLERINEELRPRVIQFLQYIVKNDPKVPVQEKAIESLCLIGGAAVDQFFREQMEENQGSFNSILIIKHAPKLSVEIAIPLLKEAFEQNNDLNIRQTILQSLNQIEGEPGTQAMMDLLETLSTEAREDYQFYIQIVNYLCRREHEDLVLPFLKDKYEEGNLYIKGQIAHYIVNISRPDVTDTLIEWYSNTDNDNIKMTIIRSLTKTGEEGVDFVKELTIRELNDLLKREVSIALSSIGLNYNTVRSELLDGEISSNDSTDSGEEDSEISIDSNPTDAQLHQMDESISESVTENGAEHPSNNTDTNPRVGEDENNGETSTSMERLLNMETRMEVEIEMLDMEEDSGPTLNERIGLEQKDIENSLESLVER